jgi:hypothetical protein
MRQLVKARVLASTGIPPVLGADLYPSLSGVGTAATPPADNGHRVDVGRERGLEPSCLLNGTDIPLAVPIRDRRAVFHEYGAGKVADRHARCQLGVVCRYLQLSRISSSP